MAGGNELANPGGALILLSGLPGAGKTTLARAIAATFPAATVDVIESDAVRRAIAPRPSYVRQESALVFKRVEELATAALHAGRIAIVDATNVHSDDRRRFVRLARMLDVLLVAVRVVAPEDTVRERLSGPRDGFSEADFAIYEQMRGRLRPFTIPVIVVDTRFDTAMTVTLVRRMALGGA